MKTRQMCPKPFQ